MLENGFNGFPRACRSARVRGPIGKRSDGGQNHSFEILASVAGKLLDKGDKFLHSHSSCTKEQYCTCDDTISMKKFDEDSLDLGNCDEKIVARDLANENFDSEIYTTLTDFKGSGMIDPDETLETCDGKKDLDKSPHFPEAIKGKVWSGIPEGTQEIELSRNRKRSIKDEIDDITGISGDQKTLEGKPPGLAGLFTCHTSNIRAVSEDDVENSFAALSGTKIQEVKKISETMNHIVASVAMDDNHCSDDGKMKELYDDKTSCYTHERSQKIFPFKKRKFFNHDPLSTSDRGFDREGIFNSYDKRINNKTCAASQRITPNSKDCNVKLSIKSFKVPELFIDISTNATVGSLKRTVMEAVTSILGDGLHVGLLVHGKKVRDDNKTLVQTGISQDDKCHNLGFVLEPKHSRTTTSTRIKNECLMSRSRSHGLTRHCASLTSTQGTSNVSLHRPVKSLGGGIESDLNADHAFVDTSSNKLKTNCKSMVAVPSMSMEALAVVPLARKSGHHEYVQRRIRRPFSVSEVEALVRAVEKLGTGRWRDVKFHAFDNAKHRTYVDLKDKWKTLVHTARISPQQRRGEPVPQELLDRVLAAQAHWSHRQAKQHARIAV